MEIDNELKKCWVGHYVYEDNSYKEVWLPYAKNLAKATKNQYNENFYKNEYEEYINSYLGEYPSSCDVDKILKKWKVSSTDSVNQVFDRGTRASHLIYKPEKFQKGGADKLTNFNPSTDTLEIDTYSFGIDDSATFLTGRNLKEVKKKLAKQDSNFLYDQKKGGLYFNENGAEKGFGDGGIIAILKGAPDLTAMNIDFI